MTFVTRCTKAINRLLIAEWNNHKRNAWLLYLYHHHHHHVLLHDRRKLLLLFRHQSNITHTKQHIPEISMNLYDNNQSSHRMVMWCFYYNKNSYITNTKTLHHHNHHHTKRQRYGTAAKTHLPKNCKILLRSIIHDTWCQQRMEATIRRTFSTTTTTTAVVDNPKTNTIDYRTNDGIIEGVWIFSRHGDRTPSRPLSPDHQRLQEAAYWMTKLPIPDSTTVFDSYSKYYPVQIHCNTIQQQEQRHPHTIANTYTTTATTSTTTQALNVTSTSTVQPHSFIDTARNPFGFLTSKGLQQLSINGQKFYHRYNHHGHHIPDGQLFQSPQDFLSIWNVQAYSTNYLRTIMSVQSFLDGMLGTNCYNPIPIDQERTYDPNITKEIHIPLIPTGITDIHNSNSINHTKEGNQPLVTINVRNIQNDPLNAFDRNPELISDLVSEVMTSDDFIIRDGKAASLAARLANILPGLVRRKKNTTTTINKSSDFSSRAPSGINWVEAADHFICRASHNVPLSKFSDYETDEYEQYLQAMSYPTLAHLSWRFRKWYQHDRLLAVIAAPPLREITNNILQTPSLPIHERRPFVIYSCHDITILGLLYGIGADFLATDSTDHDVTSHTSGYDVGSWRYWPNYGSNLVFELVRVRDGQPGADSHVIRVLLDGVPVNSIKHNHTMPSNENIGTGVESMFSINDFEQLVTKLEEAGGHDYANLLGS